MVRARTRTDLGMCLVLKTVLTALLKPVLLECNLPTPHFHDSIFGSKVSCFSHNIEMKKNTLHLNVIMSKSGI